MTREQPLCRKCGAPIVTNQNVVFPKAGGVEHLDCSRARGLRLIRDTDTAT